MQNLPKKHQTLMFSATMPVEIEELAQEYLTDPVRVKVGKVGSPTVNVSQILEKVPENEKVDPSGSYFSWKASAMGKNVSNAKTFLEKRYTEEMELDDAVHTAILTLKEGFEGQISSKNIEIGVIGSDRIFKVLTPSEVEDYLQEAE